MDTYTFDPQWRVLIIVRLDLVTTQEAQSVQEKNLKINQNFTFIQNHTFSSFPIKPSIYMYISIYI